jgi:hypothetical protein
MHIELWEFWGMGGWGERAVDEHHSLPVRTALARGPVSDGGGEGVVVFSKKPQLCSLIEGLFLAQRHRWRLVDISLLDRAVPPGFLVQSETSFRDVVPSIVGSERDGVKYLHGLVQLEELMLIVKRASPRLSDQDRPIVSGNSGETDLFEVALRASAPCNTVLIDTSSSKRLRLLRNGGATMLVSHLQSIATARDMSRLAQKLSFTGALQHHYLTTLHINESAVFMFPHCIFLLACTPRLVELTISCSDVPPPTAPPVMRIRHFFNISSGTSRWTPIALSRLINITITSSPPAVHYPFTLVYCLSAIILHLRAPELRVVTYNINHWPNAWVSNLAKLIEATQHLLIRSGVEGRCEVRWHLISEEGEQ